MVTSRHKTIMKLFSNRLRKARRAAGFKSAAKAAAQLGLEPHTYRGYESGRREANYETLIRMCELYGVTVDYVLPVEALKGGRQSPTIKRTAA
jgi:transcriptional regulator with XRE-family HTH domain